MLDTLKSPFRFDERTHPFRFSDEFGAAGMVGRLGESLIPKGDPMEARLQEMLRYNIDKYASQNLDTLHIARRVRELLSIHNIGQRLFAKYVLGLSQGTVSELLSKPKPWDKLTEKGRDSYRKMHGWACDENAVMLLKSLIPKKGEYQPTVRQLCVSPVFPPIRPVVSLFSLNTHITCVCITILYQAVKTRRLPEDETELDVTRGVSFSSSSRL